MTEKEFIGRPSVDKFTHIAYLLLMLVACLVGFFFGLMEGQEENKRQFQKLSIRPISSIHYIVSTEKYKFLYSNNSFNRDTLSLHKMEMSK